MPYSPSSSSGSEFGARLIKPVTWLARLIVGAVFVFSGFVKGIDPWGTVYKFGEYLTALGVDISGNLVLAGVFGLCALEFLTGIFLLFGCYRRSAPVLAMLFMCVMLPLTLWIAVADPVADCGCFGDALIISNWATFWKNVALTALSLWLCKYNVRIPCIVTPAFQWIVMLASAIYMLAICWYGYNIQPMIDFRPFKAGTTLAGDSDSYEGPHFAFTYQKDGREQEFTEDSLPADDSGWTFASRRELPYPDESPAADDSHDFSVMDKEGSEDVTDEAIDSEGEELLMLIPSLSDISASTTYKINLLNDWAGAHDIRFAAIVASHSGNIGEWEDLSLPRYDIYTADDTAIKELARGNPAIVYLKDGVIQWKTSLYSLNEEDFASPDTRSDVMDMAPDGLNFLRNISWLYLIVMALMTSISFVPRLAALFRPLGYKKLISRDDKAHRGESSSHDISAPQKTDGPSHD